MKLATYFRSTAAYRVRIALNLKGLDHELVPIDLLKNGGQHKTPEFLVRNPDGLIPTLETEGQVLAQSVAILEYLEETHPEIALLPKKPMDRAYVRGLVQTIASDMHPLNNLRVLQFLENEMGNTEEQKLRWYQHWIAKGFTGLESRLVTTSQTGKFCFGDSPTLADVCLVPQVYNAHRFDCPMDNYATINSINKHCLSLRPFAESRPENQPDAHNA